MYPYSVHVITAYFEACPNTLYLPQLTSTNTVNVCSNISTTNLFTTYRANSISILLSLLIAAGESILHLAVYPTQLTLPLMDVSEAVGGNEDYLVSYSSAQTIKPSL